MASITILEHTYTLPAIATERFRALQEQVRTQQQAIQSGWRQRPRLLGLLRRPATQLTPDERWQELDLLVQNYDAILAELHQSKDAYEAFFGQLAAGVQQALWQQSETMQRLEEERLADARQLVTQPDATLQRLLQEDGERLMQGARLLGQAALLLLKKIALCQEGLARLVADQALQRQVLSELTGRLELHRRAYLRRQKIDQVVRDAARMAEVALHFEEYMRDHLGPLQGILEQVVQVDSDLHRAVAEIEDLTRQLAQQHRLSALPGSESLDERWLTFLTTSQLKKERLAEMWEHLERQDGVLEDLEMALATSTAAQTSSPVLTALENIRLLVQERLAPLVPTSERSRREPSSQAVSVAGAPPAPRLVDHVGMTFVLIPAGMFHMGSSRGKADEQPVHSVHISTPFYLAIYPVTQRQWEALMGHNPSHFRGPERPVEQVSWDDAQEFIGRLNAQEGGVYYRLPSEAEWEYAARARTTGEYCFGNDTTQLPQYAWYQDNAQGSTHPVGQLQPNAWGLYDMHGNVWEWVQDWYAPDTYQHLAAIGTAVVDPAGPPAGVERVLRGGGWLSEATKVRSAQRLASRPDHRNNVVCGFRLARRP
ncbi:MAG: formylglycine-generating enzyme family protein [Candidatus Tectimicrobiota bacterium]